MRLSFVRRQHRETLPNKALGATGSAQYGRIMYRKSGTHAGAPKSSRLPCNDLHPPNLTCRKLNPRFSERQKILLQKTVSVRTKLIRDVSPPALLSVNGRCSCRPANPSLKLLTSARLCRAGGPPGESHTKKGRGN